MPKRSIVIIAHDIRSTHNVGSLLRTAEGLGIEHVYFTGYTPYPVLPANDTRLPHITSKLTAQIHKTALGAENMVAWSHLISATDCIAQLKASGYTVVALEQDKASTPLPSYHPPVKVALLLGREVEGIDPELLHLCDVLLEIPMSGRKESFNVVQAAAMALYKLRFD
jgi:23S rRNA (guanosine2251-2'-O)-methyltransferase